MISHGVFAMAMRRRLTAFTFGLYPGRIDSQFAPSLTTVAGDVTPAAAPYDTFTATAGLTVGGALDAVISYAREDILPADSFTATAALTVGGALEIVIAYARVDLKPVDTFTATAGLTVGGALETV